MCCKHLGNSLPLTLATKTWAQETQQTHLPHPRLLPQELEHSEGPQMSSSYLPETRWLSFCRQRLSHPQVTIQCWLLVQGLPELSSMQTYANGTDTLEDC